MAADPEPPELARLVDFAETPRTDGWSLRAALVRYAQPEPQRVNDLMDLVRRTDWALGQHASLLQRHGPALWAALGGAAPAEDREQAHVVELLAVTETLSELGDVVAAWAVDIHGDRPDAAVDAVTADVAARLEALGVPPEERPPGPRSRG